MAVWTTPHLFITGELFTASLGNTYISDNLQYLKDNGNVVLAAMSVYASGTVSITSSAAFPFDTEDSNVGAMHDSGANTRGKVPAGAGGYYVMGFMVRVSTIGTSTCTPYFRKGGSTRLNRGILLNTAVNNIFQSMTFGCPLVAGDYVEVFMSKGDSSSWTFSVATGEAQFNMTRIGS